MLASSTATQNPGAAHASFESKYRTETSFKNLSEHLNKRLTVAGRHPNRYAQFSLLEFLKALQITEGIIKGSAVQSWQQKRTTADIDLQFAATHADPLQDMPAKIVAFLEKSSTGESTQNRSDHNKAWLAKVAHDMTDAWQRLIISVGYPKTNSTTLDLNFSTQRKVSYDAVHASQAMQFDLARRKAFAIGSWHPSLVNWMRDYKLLWFKPDIDEGLNRMSYRLSKAPEFRMLQPDIGQQFLHNASQDSLSNIYLRILKDEYSTAQLTAAERAFMWLKVVEAAESQDTRVLLPELLMWTKFSEPGVLKEALRSTSTQVAVVLKLSEAAKIGSNLKEALRRVLVDQTDLRKTLEPLITRALGAQLVEGPKLFAALDASEQILEVPDHELQAVFTACLKELAKGTCGHTQQRANNMLGWLENDPLCTLQFWIDRGQSCATGPSHDCMFNIVQNACELIRQEGVAALAPAIDRLSQLAWSDDDWQTLMTALQEPPQQTEDPMPLGTHNSALTLLQWLAQHSSQLAAMRSGGSSSLDSIGLPMITAPLFQRTQAMAQHLLEQPVPRMLQSVTSVKADKLTLKLGDMSVQAAGPLDLITLAFGRQTHWIGENMHARLKPLTTTGQDTFCMTLLDGTRFTGQASGTGHFMFDGTLTCMGPNILPEGLAGLLRQGRALAKSQFYETSLDHHFWMGKGNFSGQSLLKVNHAVDALKAMKHGMIADQSLNSTLCVQHEIKDHTPTHCTVLVRSDVWNSRTRLAYRSEAHSLNIPIELSNAWGVILSEAPAESQLLVHIPPMGPVNLLCTLPFSVHQRASSGWVEVQSQGPVAFRWRGRMDAGRCLPFGNLFLDRQTRPALDFDASDASGDIPITMLPVMADLIGKRLNGHYPFVPTVWNDRTRWPDPGFEGFVHRQEHGEHRFSGYVTATGKAIGILNKKGNVPSSQFDQAWSGAFMLTPSEGVQHLPMALDDQEPGFVGLQVSAQSIMVPHGRVRMQFLNKADQSPAGQIERVYFCGEGLAYAQFSPAQGTVYDSPRESRYMVGMGYCLKGKPMHVDMVFNAGDGGPDYVIIRPVNYERISNHQALYYDDLGTKASFVVQNGRYRMADIRFPSGLIYVGEVLHGESACQLTGRGKITLGPLSFGIECTPDGGIRRMRGLNETSTHWIGTYEGRDGRLNFKLHDLVELISDGHLSWSRDIEPSLMIRQLRQLKGIATVFSRLAR